MSDGQGHILIGGTGRSGTTLLVQILTHLDFDTGFSKDEALANVDGISRAGLETRLYYENLPQVIKSPWLCDEVNDALESGFKVEAAIIPLRDLFEAAESRRQVYRQAEAEGKDPLAHPGSIWKTTEASGQEAALALQLYKFIDPLVNHDIPLVFLSFPRFVADGDYLYRKLEPIVAPRGITRERLLEVHGRLADPNLVSRFHSPLPEPSPPPSPEPAAPPRRTPSKELSGLGAFISPASFWEPEYLKASAWMEHGPFAFWLMDAVRPGNLVELGTHYGYSYFAMCQALQTLAVPCRCHAVDTWQGDEQAGLYGDDVYETVRAHNAEHYAGSSTLLRMTFDQAQERFADGSIDLLHIDGFHSYEQVKHDFDSWRPKLSDRAVVLLHDTYVRQEGFGVCRLWDELVREHPHFEFTHGYGLGVLGVGASVPEGVQALFAADADQRLCYGIRAVYQRLGAVVSRQWAQENREAGLRAEMLKLGDNLQDMTQQLSQRDAQFDEVVNSTAWRLTQPLRTLSTRVKKLSGK